MAKSRYRLELLGAFRLFRDGARVHLSSRRGQILLAMLASSPSGEHARGWLQDRLWGSRGVRQSQDSLRRELSNLRKQVNLDQCELLLADGQRVWLDLDLVDIDLRREGAVSCGEFLEGFDLPGEEGFEDWLRGERMRFVREGGRAARAVLPPQSTGAIDIGEIGGTLTSAVIEEPGDSTRAGHEIAERLARLRWLGLIANSSNCAARFGIRLEEDRDVREDKVLWVTLTDRHSSRQLWSGKIPYAQLQDEAISLADLAVAELRARIIRAEQNRAISSGQGESSLAVQSGNHSGTCTV